MKVKRFFLVFCIALSVFSVTAFGNVGYLSVEDLDVSSSDDVVVDDVVDDVVVDDVIVDDVVDDVVVDDVIVDDVVDDSLLFQLPLSERGAILVEPLPAEEEEVIVPEILPAIDTFSLDSSNLPYIYNRHMPVNSRFQSSYYVKGRDSRLGNVVVYLPLSSYGMWTLDVNNCLIYSGVENFNAFIDSSRADNNRLYCKPFFNPTYRDVVSRDTFALNLVVEESNIDNLCSVPDNNDNYIKVFLCLIVILLLVLIFKF